MNKNWNYILLAGFLIFGRPDDKEDVVETVEEMFTEPSQYDQQYEVVFNMIKEFEGYSPNAYWDVDNWRYGYGTTAEYKGQYISQEDAEKLAREEFNKRIERIKEKYANLDDWQTLIVAAFHFNVQNIGNDLHYALLSGDNHKIEKQMKRYKFAGKRVMNGLVERRNMEIALLQTNGDISEIHSLIQQN